jgi:hypothetical protein
MPVFAHKTAVFHQFLQLLAFQKVSIFRAFSGTVFGTFFGTPFGTPCMTKYN